MIYRTDLVLVAVVLAVLFVLESINTERDDPVRLDDRLMEIATEHSLRMSSSNDLFHSDLSVVPGGVKAENIGVGSSVEEVQQAFIDSPLHYANLTDSRFKSVGIGIVEDDRVWVTQIFSDIEGTHAEGISWVLDEGLMFGYPDGTFRPHEPMTRGQMATLLMRYDDSSCHGVADDG